MNGLSVAWTSFLVDTLNYNVFNIHAKVLFNLKQCFCRLKEAQLSVKRITGEKKVETRKINPNSLVRHDSVHLIY